MAVVEEENRPGILDAILPWKDVTEEALKHVKHIWDMEYGYFEAGEADEEGLES